MTKEDAIFCEARRLGFAAAGIAAAGPTETFPVFREWVDGGSAAGMSYLARHDALRSDPRLLAPGTRSILVVAARYPVNASPGDGFSTYAGGMDYHTVLREKLKALVVFIRQQFPVSVARICVDSAPLLEREWAVRAGIGWRGRQGQIVNARLGCCLLLGELLLDAELKPSERVPNRCGRCRRCVAACPTGAIGQDGLVDARRCISYLTIEHKGELPAETRPLLGQALFGCDLCSAVCPWNRFGGEAVMPEFQGHDMPNPRECLTMSESDFSHRFRDTAVFRTGLQRLQRNAAVALENDKS